jgi:hypothetical protein
MKSQVILVKISLAFDKIFAFALPNRTQLWDTHYADAGTEATKDMR